MIVRPVDGSVKSTGRTNHAPSVGVAAMTGTTLDTAGRKCKTNPANRSAALQTIVAELAKPADLRPESIVHAVEQYGRGKS